MATLKFLFATEQFWWHTSTRCIQLIMMER